MHHGQNLAVVLAHSLGLFANIEEFTATRRPIKSDYGKEQNYGGGEASIRYQLKGFIHLVVGWISLNGRPFYLVWKV